MAKNITEFAPGMVSSTSLGLASWCVSVAKAGNGCHINGAPRGPNYGGHGHYWKVPTGVTQARFIWSANGANAGGSCCCSGGAPGRSGSYGIFDLNVTEGNEWCFCMGAGNCCVASSSGQAGCIFYIYSVTNNQTYFASSAASCSCSSCNYYTGSSCCDYVCYGNTGTPNRCFDADKEADGTSVFGCNNCWKGDGGTPSICQPTIDSDENVFRSRSGFSVRPCCWTAATALCGTYEFTGLNHMLTNKSHYFGAPSHKGYISGFTQHCGLYRAFGGTNGTYGQGGHCMQGAGPYSSYTNSSTCCCSGGGGAAFLTIWYK